MTKTPIATTVSQKELSFQPGTSTASFEVTAVNESDRFATFQLELLAPGIEANSKRRWYELAPEISAKKPPGDQTRFKVTITDTPIPGFAGVMNLTVRTFSLELGEDRKLVRLNLESGTAIPVKVDLPIKQYQVNPFEQIDILVRVHNPSQKITDVMLGLTGLPPEWLPSGTEHRLRLEPGSLTEVLFAVSIPPTTQTICGRYAFAVRATQPNGPPSSATGVVELRPSGQLELTCSPTQHVLPPKGAGWRWWADTVDYWLEFTNQSNVPEQVSVNLSGDDVEQITFQVLPDRATLAPGEKLPVQLTASTRRPWWGWGKHLLFEVNGLLSDPRTTLRDDTQVLRLKVKPKLPLWMQLLLAVLLLYGIWWCSWMNPENPFYGHRAAVNSVQFNAVGTELLSTSDDQRIIHWNAPAFFNPLAKQQVGLLGQAQKSVRVVRYRPLGNEWAATGLENGEIQLWHLGTHQDPSVFSYQKDDRVMSLAFTRGSRYLFSGHGSGMVLQWGVNDPDSEAGLPTPDASLRRRQLDFAIYGMTLIGNADDTLAIGGRYNKLVFWNWQKDTLKPIPYPRVGGQEDYITSVVKSEYNPYLLATADNQGYITLWNLRPCMEGDQPCEVIEEWQDGHDGQPVRGLALSDVGCYLASAGADGRVKLWVLDKESKRDARFVNGIVVSRRPRAFNTVDVKVVDRDVVIASGNDDSQVRLAREPRKPEAMCDLYQ
ncbi:hypothetical protein ACN4EK_20605 [Pantanalinema rosaneae CENA516]|uniref:hypothetical protein n=1 Tax=Pantanalinema rosaneae TaxID=1620701 RepID=UPI003D6F1840